MTNAKPSKNETWIGMTEEETCRLMILETNIKNQNDLDKYLDILESKKYQCLSITSKKNNLPIETILARLKTTNCIPTFSCSVNYNQNLDNTLAAYDNFIKQIKKFNIEQILIVSGNPKRKLDTLELLQRMKLDPKIKIAVAYNPYSKDIAVENTRLKQKLSYRNVNQVWLQLGQDCKLLKGGIDFIRSFKPNITIVNSVLLPSNNLLNSLRLRPWSGVYYTEQFYNNLEFAYQEVEAMKKKSIELGLKILVSGV